ncbi:phosphotransferase family protein [Arthrobacter sp. zg-Y820]|uniref:phosphotransferase family protein n=1 Tax=unclassified Arthrobacter TaxID=235627 RepID=UPI001E5757FE|nr:MULTISPECIES: phosphotransferase family protein [unclassified Arthrobacter]MCC9197071.1 phosphotransferase family protein [Arthrobacter sp. zg-Y820]MDK1279936.1 phosphotransferase family protein [Arthrobacter sp. zg.Y820]WIB09235.1 phosphotransferase family protein [Arthrobacter sp. zg-Y820]
MAGASLLHSVPDGTEVVATQADAEALASPPLLILDAVTAFLDAHNLGSGPLSWAQIGDGQSNITYRIQRGSEVFVLRRGPRPPLPPSTHDMVREARIQQLLHTQGVPVPDILAVCEDESVLGVPFYVMTYLEGLVITDTVPAPLNSAAQRLATSNAVVDTLVQLHRVDVTVGGLASFGRPDGYLRRQVERFSALWDINTTRSLPDVARLGSWLADNLPESQHAAVLHGDYRQGNLMFHGSAPARVTAVLDWEMAAVGDPLADLGYLTATYAEPGSPPSPLELSAVTRGPGYLRRSELIARYQAQTGLSLEALPWYQALALWKASIFCEAIYTRWLKGERPNDTRFAPSLEAGVPQLLEQARAFAGLLPTSTG